jgi:PAS domain S-box-containing protein
MGIGIQAEDAEHNPHGPDSLPSAVLAAALDSVIVMNDQGLIVELNPAAQQTFGYRREEAVGRELATLMIPPALRERHRRALRELRERGGEPRVGSGESARHVRFDHRIELVGMRSDGSEFPIELTVTRVARDPPLFTGFIRDITELRRATEAKDLLASASAAFDTSLDPLQTMRTIARTAVPRLADLCVVDLIREDGTIGDSVVAAVEQQVTQRLEELRAREPLDVAGPHPVARALRSRKPVWIHDLTDPVALVQVAQSDEHLQFMRDTGYRSAVVIKLSARGRLLGALSFLLTRNGRDFEAEHLLLMQELANRAAMALDNSNLYAERTRVARTLQRSLLPDALPKVHGVQLASAYHPVGEGSEVGGDFYDVFEIASGCWLVVGDVCGKGTEAAAVTALVRHSIRALALQQASPAQVLRNVNQVMLSHKFPGRFATAILARIDLTRSTARAAIASAGHPPPVLLSAAGEASRPMVSGTLLGVLPEIRTHDLQLELFAGDSLVFYTDGLTDAGAPRREVAPEELCNHLSRNAPATPRALVARLEELATARSGGRLRDDIAILAARIQP